MVILPTVVMVVVVVAVVWVWVVVGVVWGMLLHPSLVCLCLLQQWFAFIIHEGGSVKGGEGASEGPAGGGLRASTSAPRALCIHCDICGVACCCHSVRRTKAVTCRPAGGLPS